MPIPGPPATGGAKGTRGLGAGGGPWRSTPPMGWLIHRTDQGLPGLQPFPARQPAAGLQVGQQQQPPLPRPKQMSTQLLGVATKSSTTTVPKSNVATTAKGVGTRPKSAGLEAPVQYMLRMTGELRDETTLGLRSVPRPPMWWKPSHRAQRRRRRSRWK